MKKILRTCVMWNEIYYLEFTKVEASPWKKDTQIKKVHPFTFIMIKVIFSSHAGSNSFTLIYILKIVKKPSILKIQKLRST